jgi:hypothetical protein
LAQPPQALVLHICKLMKAASAVEQAGGLSPFLQFWQV